MAGTRLSFILGNEASLDHGFLGSDNISFNGAFLALKGGPVILDIAKKGFIKLLIYIKNLVF
jgi:hypothetical protein